MRKLITVVLALVLLCGGCASFKQAFCSPTATQTVAAIDAAAQIATVIPFLQGIPAAAMTVAALNAVLPGVNQVRNGYCVSDMDNFLQYAGQLIAGADTQAKQLNKNFKGLKAMGLKK